MQPLDFVAIGDITTDAFIRLKDASVHCDVDREHCLLCMRFGDKIPYEFVEIIRAVGNAGNAAVTASRLGLKSAIVTNIGDDQNGKECRESLVKDRVVADFIKIHPDKPTNYHYVLWYEDERTILIKHTEFDYQFLQDLPAPKWMYLTSLPSVAENYHDQIARYLRDHPETKLAFQPGTFQIKLGPERLKEIYGQAEIFFCNKNEAKLILKKPEEEDIKKMLADLAALGPKMVIMSDGPRGAFIFDGNNYRFMPIYPDPKPPYERTGAGDAFASTITSALALGMPIEQALSWGPINAMSVVQQIGAQRGLLSRPELERFLAEAPSDYQPRPL
ncbi:MAG: hypothetical protein A2849_03555 [Candidatus Taylorbacteria bacterium RIFCSPHIGHO2_01_FULL_51_15]|uniref:Carbohydrate kinase PfkB domain-containing protein n=1 Tax=Candidatus Taylorbacteria bacterium RIFCSPHIGHO2_01_FULL_51_15 TaxID=1802304 RepID=A0A1G2M8A8_9BACT|nr:MAG: hypothetical protein A2849_03555 [Candidatus Taylorbacteria bacterium RIFCSPHIGHO2_01_FULL_51_15]